MPAFNRTYRQQVIDEYLNATRRNSFVPHEFLEWLEPQEDHRVWGVFFGKDDADAAHQYRLMLTRQFVAGLRIVVQAVAATETEPAVMVKVPAFISPVASRREGGGYVSVDVRETDTRREMCRQAAEALEAWVRRWAGVARLESVEIDAINQIAGALAARGVEEAA